MAPPRISGRRAVRCCALPGAMRHPGHPTPLTELPAESKFATNARSPIRKPPLDTVQQTLGRTVLGRARWGRLRSDVSPESVTVRKIEPARAAIHNRFGHKNLRREERGPTTVRTSRQQLPSTVPQPRPIRRWLAPILGGLLSSLRRRLRIPGYNRFSQPKLGAGLGRDARAACIVLAVLM